MKVFVNCLRWFLVIRGCSRSGGRGDEDEVQVGEVYIC